MDQHSHYWNPQRRREKGVEKSIWKNNSPKYSKIDESYESIQIQESHEIQVR